MLFNSIEFIFFFLPIVLLVYFFLYRIKLPHLTIPWLVCCSLFFYGWWNPIYLSLIIFSILFNYFLGKQLSLGKKESIRKIQLWLGISINMGLLGYFKYTNFLIDQINLLPNVHFQFDKVLLPLAISFFTFQQIAFLVDSYRRETKEYRFLHYCLFVTFFPQLIAGPIVHHKSILPQFSKEFNHDIAVKNIVIGLSIFAIGLFKKTVIADGVAPYANVVFDSTPSNDPLTFFVAWGGALAYTIQLYFDFSGYSDMAIGLARMFGIILPLNFYSPYKAINISEFWRRWHITLSNFLRDYVYIALGGNRKGSISRYKNLLITMLLGGIWHGAGWNFVIWGALHGSYLTTHQLWSKYTTGKFGFINDKVKTVLAWLITFLAVVIGWVFFRATTMEGAFSILQGMAGLNGAAIPNAIYARLDFLVPVFDLLSIQPYSGGGSNFTYTWLWVCLILPLALILPNTQDLFATSEGSLSKKSYIKDSAYWPFYEKVKNLHWQPNTVWALVVATALVAGFLTLTQVSEFLYFQF